MTASRNNNSSLGSWGMPAGMPFPLRQTAATLVLCALCGLPSAPLLAQAPPTPEQRREQDLLDSYRRLLTMPAPNATPANPAPANAMPAEPPPAPLPSKPVPTDKPAQIEAVKDGPPLGGFSLQNADLVGVIDQLARLAKINYSLDPKVRGSVTLNTYGETKNVKPLELLEAILRINGAAMVQMGNVYRIVPTTDLAHMPLRPESKEKDIPDDEQAMLNLIFLKYASVEELGKLTNEFLGQDGKVWMYPAANLLLIQDTRRNMRRLMELVAMFDSDALAKQRVKVFELTHSRPTDMAKELENLFKSISLSKEAVSVHFVPIDRINALIAVAPNPGIFTQVEEWVTKLDIKVKSAAGKSDNYVYRLKYGRADQIAMSIMNLYFSLYMPFGGGMYGGGMNGGGMYGGGAYGAGMYGGGMGYGGANGAGMYGNGMYGGGGYGMNANMYGAGAGNTAPQTAIGGFSPLGGVGSGASQPGLGATPNALGSLSTGSTGDLTGAYLGSGNGMGAGMFMQGSGQSGPRVMPNLSDNSLLILATPEQYESVEKLLQQLDLPPRQVLIEAQILEVTLTGNFSSGVSAWLQARGAANPGAVAGSPTSPDRRLVGAFNGLTTTLSAGTLVGQSRQLFGLLTAQESSGRTKVISTPRVIATDSIAASISVGEQVPTLSSQALTGAQSSGNSLFANTISNVSTGTTLAITARVNPSGVVTLQIDQQVSAPIAPAAGSAIQSPSFSNRQVKTQVTVQDGDMVAIGGIINETKTESSSGIPILHKLPWIGGAFGSKTFTKERTELVIFLTPRVIYDTNGIAEASDDVLNGMKRVKRLVRE